MGASEHARTDALWAAWSADPAPEGAGAASRRADPLVVALGNASLLGVGYVLLGRPRWAVAAVLGSVALVVVLVTAAPVVWFELVVLGWALAAAGHGGWLARRGAPPITRAGRIAGVGVALCAVAVVGLLRADAARIADRVAAAPDCDRAAHAAEARNPAHRVADAPLDEWIAATPGVCERLWRAEVQLMTAVKGEAPALGAGLREVRAVLAEHPDRAGLAAAVLDRFLTSFPLRDSCRSADYAAVLRRDFADLRDAGTRPPPEVLPEDLLACADGHLRALPSEPGAARARYRQLIEEFPGDPLAAEARAGLVEVRHTEELATVRDLLAGEDPPYCARPAPYGGAEPFVRGKSNRTLPVGDLTHAGGTGAAWVASDVSQASAVLCVSEVDLGPVVRTCAYVTDDGRRYDIAFRRATVPIRLVEVRTGRLITATALAFPDRGCPSARFVHEGQERLTEAPLPVPKEDFTAALRSIIG